MKNKLPLILAVLTQTVSSLHGQGTFIYDQQSSDESYYVEGSGRIQQSQPFGQSFTPSLSAVGFIRLTIFNGLFGNESQANIVVNLRSNSVSGSLLGASQIVSIPGGSLFSGPVNFVFTSPISVTPGVVYYFQPEVLNNNNLGLYGGAYNYAGGTAFGFGVAVPTDDLWFREGIVVPEPSPVSLLLLGGSIVTWFACRNRGRT